VVGRRTVAHLAAYPILAQTERSGLQAVVNEWLLQHRVDANLMLSSNSLSTLCGLTLAGFGLSMLPKDYFFHHVEAGRLKSSRPSRRSRCWNIMSRTGRTASTRSPRSSPMARCEPRPSATELLQRLRR
jgi:DNA-binding transcriptional LysR family regulator